MQDTLPSMFEYNRWADERLLAACSQLTDAQYAQEVGGSFPSIRGVVAHLAGAAHAWRTRFEGGVVTSLLPEGEVGTVEVALGLIRVANDVLMREANRPAEELNQILSYRSIRGFDVSLPRWAALRHVVNHATYHRGQIANMMRQVGVAPPSTDYFLWAMEQYAASSRG
jgi:uncharacterized damage-inducible protein DinB